MLSDLSITGPRERQSFDMRRATLRKYTFENIYMDFAFFMLLGEMINSLYSDSHCSLICYLSNFCMWKSLCGSWETHFNNLVSGMQTLNGHFYLDTQLFPSYCFCSPVSMSLKIRCENLTNESSILFRCL